jgi:hypothetical protein
VFERKIHLADALARIYLSVLLPLKLSTSCMIVLAVPTEQLMSSTPTSQTLETQSVNSTEQMPKVNQSAWNFYRLPSQPHHEATHEPGKTIHSIESRTPEAYSTGSKRPRPGRDEQEVQAQAKIEAMVVADVAAETETLHPGIDEATLANPLPTASTATCRDKTTADPPADGDMEVEEEEEEEEEGQEKKLEPADLVVSAENNEAESEAAKTQETEKLPATDW